MITKFNQFLNEKWEKKVEIEKTDKHADKTVAEIRKEMASLKGKKPFNRELYSELLFALRAKQGWKKGEGSTKAGKAKKD
jgi:phosphate uptake regulator